MADVAIATSSDYPELGPFDRGFVAALADVGVSAEPAVWSDAAGAWRSAKAVVIRSTWDSHIAPDRFLAWADEVERTRLLLNPARLLRWNLHKFYLRELEARGVPVTPTEWLRRGETADLGELMRRRGWGRAVVKPAVSASAHETHIVTIAEAGVAQPVLDRLAKAHDLLVQPYLRAFETEGERSFVFFDGCFSHAVRRPPTLANAPRGFDSPAVMAPDPVELGLAERVMAALDESPLYARVDLATDNDGTARLQEIELVEPCLFLSLAEGAVDRLAAGIAARL
ncbi:ATP-grasp domain-containing protein [Sphingosinicella terrae]|uniref:ATP-grasp domain-containing protein n=1 Tax=Sphingosinicella terrae TaxID=2172047 RepID=UPI000E0CCDE1|nr:hypothetical protein [Sphingosinicella terrae]